MLLLSEMPFFNPRLTGSRFEDHQIPVEILEDFKLYEDLLKKVAKWVYYQENGRERVPSGFGDGVSLKLTGVEDGSAIATIALAASTFVVGELDTQTYFVQARDLIAKTIEAAGSGRDEIFIPKDYLYYFNKIGRRLKEDEAIEFAPGSPNVAKLNTAVRRRLVAPIQEIDSFEEETIIRGTITGLEKDDRTCNIKYGKSLKISVDMSLDNFHLFKDAYDSYDGHKGKKVKLEGVGSYRNGRLHSMQVDSITILDKMDIPARLEEFLLLDRGWLDGDGEDFKQEHINWLISQVDSRLPNDVYLPFAFPTVEGEVQFEWKHKEHDLSTYVNLLKKSAYIHYFNTLTEEEKEYEEVDLSNEDGWAILSSELEKHFKTV